MKTISMPERDGLAAVRECLVAETHFEKMRGLLGRKDLPEGVAMLLPGATLLHTLGMKFALDIAFLGRDGLVVGVRRNVPPGNLFIWGGLQARSALEARAGWLCR